MPGQPVDRPAQIPAVHDRHIQHLHVDVDTGGAKAPLASHFYGDELLSSIAGVDNSRNADSCEFANSQYFSTHCRMKLCIYSIPLPVPGREEHVAGLLAPVDDCATPPIHIMLLNVWPQNGYIANGAGSSCHRSLLMKSHHFS